METWIILNGAYTVFLFAWYVYLRHVDRSVEETLADMDNVISPRIERIHNQKVACDGTEYIIDTLEISEYVTVSGTFLVISN